MLLDQCKFHFPDLGGYPLFFLRNQVNKQFNPRVSSAWTFTGFLFVFLGANHHLNGGNTIIYVIHILE